MTEIYKPIISWLPDNMPGSTLAVVEVSNIGNVRRLPYVKWNSKNKGYSKMKAHQYVKSKNRGKQVRDSIDRIDKYHAYESVSIRGKTYSVHRLVAMAFIPNDDGKEHVNHINCVRDDNRVENLEWVSNAENVAHSWSSGARTVEAMMTIKPSDECVIARARMKGASLSDIASTYGVTSEAIRFRLSRILTKKQISALSKYDRLIARMPRFLNSGVGITETCYGYKLKKSGKIIGKFKTKEEAELFKMEFVKNEKNRIYSEILEPVANDHEAA